MSIDEKPVRRCAHLWLTNEQGDCVSIDEKPVRRCAPKDIHREDADGECPSMRNPSGGAPEEKGEASDEEEVSIDEKPVRRCANHLA